MSFTKRLVEDSLPIWEDCLNSEFLQRMADGSLDLECLKGYIVDDSLYLREYAKVFAWGMTKAEDMDAIRSYYSLLSFVNEGRAPPAFTTSGTSASPTETSSTSPSARKIRPTPTA